MTTEIFQLEVITPCFCGGARPGQQAEIRVPSIRGQLRWWFRVLGGFRSLAHIPVHEQEDRIFGAARNDAGQASKLIIRVSPASGSSLVTTLAKNSEAMNAQVGTDRGYLLFPLRNNPKAVFDMGALPKFDMHVSCRGDQSLWPGIKALVTVFGHLGSLGFRSRRAMGALAFRKDMGSVGNALGFFTGSSQLLVRSLPASNADTAISSLARWLKNWRSHGRSGRNGAEQASPGFFYAKNDHDVNIRGNEGTTYRPAIGLPIIQRYSAGTTNNWEYGSGRPDPKGRFASPVLLRPYRQTDGTWRALVIFVESRKWPTGKSVYVNNLQRNVSLDLYDAMKNDPRLAAFP